MKSVARINWKFLTLIYAKSTTYSNKDIHIEQTTRKHTCILNFHKTRLHLSLVAQACPKEWPRLTPTSIPGSPQRLAQARPNEWPRPAPMSGPGLPQRVAPTSGPNEWPRLASTSGPCWFAPTSDPGSPQRVAGPPHNEWPRLAPTSGPGPPRVAQACPNKCPRLAPMVDFDFNSDFCWRGEIPGRPV